MGKRAVSNRKGRTLEMESLERRELMASDVTASLSRGTLTITGTDQPDHVRIMHNQVNNTITVFRGHDSRNPLIPARPAGEFSRFQIDLKGGNDRLEVNVGKALESILIDMGSGRGEVAEVHVGNLSILNVNATRSTHMSVNLRAQITDRALINFGSGDDDLNINTNSRVASLTVNAGDGRDKVLLTSTHVDRALIQMGNDADTMTIKGSSIHTADFNLGAGNDRINIDEFSSVAGGTIDGGAGTDTYVNKGPSLSRVSIRSFER